MTAVKYNISENSDKPAYIQLYEQIKGDIVSGAFTLGDKLPSKRLLAQEAAVSVITVQHSYLLLCDEGYVEARQRSGYFVIYKSSDFMNFSQKEVSYNISVDIPHASGSEFPFSVLAKTMRRVISEYGPLLLERADNKGCLRFRQAICTYLKRNVGIDAEPAQIIIGAGSEYLYGMVVQLLGNDRVYALENPSYEKIQKVYASHGVRCELLDLGENGIKTSCLNASCASVLHITPFNSYPSLITASASKRAEYIRWAEGRNGIIVEDNYDSELTVSKKNDDTVFSLDTKDRVIYINTFSQTVSPAVRAGYMVLSRSMLQEYDSKLGFYSCPVPVFEQYVLAEMICSGDFERHINRVRRAKRKLMR